MNKIEGIFLKNGMAHDEIEARGVYRTLRDEVLRVTDVGDLDDDDTLDDLECIFANYELELDWLNYVINHS